MCTHTSHFPVVRIGLGEKGRESVELYQLNRHTATHSHYYFLFAGLKYFLFAAKILAAQGKPELWDILEIISLISLPTRKNNIINNMS